MMDLIFNRVTESTAKVFSWIPASKMASNKWNKALNETITHTIKYLW